jgi:hypothetical protein
MAIQKFLFIFLIECLLIFCCTTSSAFGTNSNENKSVQSSDYLNSEVSNVDFSYYYYFFGLNSYGNTIITRNGKLPILETREQRESWNSTLEKLGDKMKDTIASKYMYPHGEIVTCGANARGYFVILFKYGSVDEPLINELYIQIDNSAREMGIHDIPVEFGYGTYYNVPVPLSEDGVRQYNFGDRNVENLSESEIHVIEEYMKQKHEPLYKGRDIADYGTIPLFKDKKEYNEWGDKLMLIYETVRDKMDPYMDKHKVISYGCSFTTLEVGISENLSSKEKTALAKEIYQIIDEEARKQNIIDIPITFKDQGKIVDNGTVNNTSNLFTPEGKNDSENSSNISNSNGTRSSKVNSAPCFGLFGSVVCLYGGWRLRKK